MIETRGAMAAWVNRNLTQVLKRGSEPKVQRKLIDPDKPRSGYYLKVETQLNAGGASFTKD
jgi:hypothetical protein